MLSDVAKKTTVHQQTVAEKSAEFAKVFREEVRLRHCFPFFFIIKLLILFLFYQQT